MSSQVEMLQNMIQPVVESMQFEFVGLEYLPMGNGALLRIYIDHEENGVNVDDCADVSRQVSALLDVEDPIETEYTLEISSPGIERPLFTAEHFKRFLGQQARVILYRPLPQYNRKKFKGVIRNVSQEQGQDFIIEIEVDREIYPLALKNIKRANLVADF